MPPRRRLRPGGTTGSRGSNGSGRGGIHFFLEEDSLTDGVRKVGPFVDKFINATMRYYEPQLENYARINAPWTDQTANARNGLVAQSGKEGDTHFIVLAHRVPYGIWLEVRWSGRYAIIGPTVETYGPKVMHTLERILERVGGGS